MFQNVRVGSMLYILHRQNQKLESGEVLSVLPSPTRQSTYMGGQYLPQNNLVDIQMKVKEEVSNLRNDMSDIKSMLSDILIKKGKE